LCRHRHNSDNGSEFINAHLFAYCKLHRITFTRSRSGNKNDGAYVEQKNWTHVRDLVGYLRYDTERELAKLNEIWELNSIYTNYFQAQQKLVSKQRNGAKMAKKHDIAQSPYQRYRVHASTSNASISGMDLNEPDRHRTRSWPVTSRDDRRSITYGSRARTREEDPEAALDLATSWCYKLQCG